MASRKKAAPVDYDRGLHVLRKRYGIDVQFVVGKMTNGATCAQQLAALVAFAEAVGDEGYAGIFRERLATARAGERQSAAPQDSRHGNASTKEGM